MIKIIIFDLGNVVLTNDWHHRYPKIYKSLYKDLFDNFSISEENGEKAWYKLWPKFQIGQISEEEFWNNFFEISNAKNTDTNLIKKIWRKYQRPLENMLDLLKKLKQNYRLAALATIPKEWLDFKIEKYDLGDYFEEIVSSGYSGIATPNPKIYEMILDKLKANPEECVFIDDKQKNLLPAEKIGIKTILFTNQRELEKDFENLGIKF